VIVNRIIFDELLEGDVKPESRREYVRIIDGFADQGCDAVALVCTEIPLLVGPDVSSLPTLDSTRLLARAAFEVAVGSRPMPTWTGAPT
jgi:aspartate/glutamate racemase